MMNCQEATRLMSEAQDRKLTLAEAAELKFHNMICKGCRNFNQQMQDLRFMMRNFARNEDMPDPDEHKKPDDPSSPS